MPGERASTDRRAGAAVAGTGAAGSEGAPFRLPLALIFAVWSLPALLGAVETYLFDAMEGMPIAFWRAFVSQASGWYFWAVATPFIFRFVRRHPIRRPLDARTFALHSGVLILCVLGHALTYTTVSRLVATRPIALSVWMHYGRVVLSWAPVMLLVYWAIVGVGHWLDYARRERERELHTAALTAQLAQAQLSALRMQLHPHFLFNTLNTIAMLVREQDTDTAVRLISQLGDVLRQVLRSAETHEVALRDELAFVRQYLEIEQLRFQDRLRVDWRIDDAALDVAVPNLVLQPLVENALRHGIARRPEAGHLAIVAAERDGTLTLTVTDDGPGPAAHPPASSFDHQFGGVGLANTRARLARLYGPSASLDLTRGPEGGAIATVTIPSRQLASAGVAAPPLSSMYAETQS